MRKINARFASLLGACATLALSAMVVSTGLSANVITMDNYNGPVDQVSCAPSCSGFIGTSPVSLSLTMADDYPQTGNSNPTTELNTLNALLALFDPARAAQSFVNKTDGDGDGFTTSLQYFAIKKSTNFWFFENTSGGSVTVNLEGATEDYSHWTEFGPSVSAVPVPAAVWLFGTALMGLVGVGKRRRKS